MRELHGTLVGLRELLAQSQSSRAITSQPASTATPQRIMVPSTPDRLLEDTAAYGYDPPAVDSDPAPLNLEPRCGQSVMGHGRDAVVRPEQAADDEADLFDYETLSNVPRRTTGRRTSQVQASRAQQTAEPPPAASTPRIPGQVGERKTNRGSKKYGGTSKKRALPVELEDGEDMEPNVQHASQSGSGRTFDLAVGLQEAVGEGSEQQQAPLAVRKPAAQRSSKKAAAAKAPKRGRGKVGQSDAAELGTTQGGRKKQSANQTKVAVSSKDGPRYQTRKQTRDLNLKDNLLPPMT